MRRHTHAHTTHTHTPHTTHTPQDVDSQLLGYAAGEAEGLAAQLAAAAAVQKGLLDRSGDVADGACVCWQLVEAQGAATQHTRPS
jgi:hypothetical protein